MACCKNFTPILLIHENDVNMKPGYKTDLKDAKTFKLMVILDEMKKLIYNYMCMLTCSSFGFVFIRKRYTL